MTAPRGTFRFALTLVVLACVLAFPFLTSGYRLYQGAQMLILAIALIGLNDGDRRCINRSREGPSSEIRQMPPPTTA
jgi:hypothetical protein